MKSMIKQYGSKKGEQIFYASKNKGVIEGVEGKSHSKKKKLAKVAEKHFFG